MPFSLYHRLHPRYDPFNKTYPANGTGVLPPLPNGVSAHNISRIMRSVVLYGVVPLASIALVLLTLFLAGKWYAVRNPDAADCSPAGLVARMLAAGWARLTGRAKKGEECEKDLEAQKSGCNCGAAAGLDVKEFGEVTVSEESDAGSFETESFDSKSVDSKSMDSKSADSKSIDTESIDSTSVDITSRGINGVDAKNAQC